MKRLSLRAPKWITFTLLLAYLVLAGGGSFLHTCQPEDNQVRCGQPGLAAQHVSPATALPALDKELASPHHGDCLACLWSSSSKQYPDAPDSTPALSGTATLLPLTQSAPYVSSVGDPSGIRGPPQV